MDILALASTTRGLALGRKVAQAGVEFQERTAPHVQAMSVLMLDTLEDLGFTQKGIANTLGVSPTTVSFWKTRRRPIPPEQFMVILETFTDLFTSGEQDFTPEQREHMAAVWQQVSTELQALRAYMADFHAAVCLPCGQAILEFLHHTPLTKADCNMIRGLCAILTNAMNVIAPQSQDLLDALALPPTLAKADPRKPSGQTT